MLLIIFEEREYMYKIAEERKKDVPSFAKILNAEFVQNNIYYGISSLILLIYVNIILQYY